MADSRLTSLVQFLAVIECKSGATGAWIVRETDNLPVEFRQWSPIASNSLSQGINGFEDVFLREFPIHREFQPNRLCYAFSVVEATEERTDLAYAALAQAIDGARGWIEPIDALAMAVPVVIVDAPVFALTHGQGGDEPIVPVPWRRVLWGDTRAQTIVDVVRAESVDEYGGALRAALEEAAKIANLFRLGAPTTG